MKDVAAIICAYNEEDTISEVLISIYSSGLFDEIIVVNDGSTDKTKDLIEGCKESCNLVDIHLLKNKGKGYAMAVGIEKSQSEIIVFVDADLKKSSALQLKEPLSQLIKPIRNGEADMVLGQPYVTILNYKINPFKSLTGERSVKREDILKITSKMQDSNFGVETLINLYYQSSGKVVKYILLPELDHLTKFNKVSFLSATKQYIKEGHEIACSAIKNCDLIFREFNK
jgi:glycosyltransferase involved in cell wall biosynthesis